LAVLPGFLLIVSQFLPSAHTQAPQIKHVFKPSKRGRRMKWLLGWLVLNALVFAWRVLVMWPQLKAKDQSVSAGGASADHMRTPARRIQAASRAVGHGVV
jgi:hypothetical protein